MVLWLVPSTPILDQTVAALKALDHPYRQALARDFGRDVTILTKPEALAMSRADAEGGATIIVSTIQSFRREKPDGEADEEGLKVYQDAGVLMEHFQHLSEAQEAGLDTEEIERESLRDNILRIPGAGRIATFLADVTDGEQEIIERFLRDVAVYLEYARTDVQRIVRSAARSADGDLVVLGHSLGAVVAREMMDDGAIRRRTVALITIGSPLIPIALG